MFADRYKTMKIAGSKIMYVIFTRVTVLTFSGWSSLWCNEASMNYECSKSMMLGIMYAAVRQLRLMLKLARCIWLSMIARYKVNKQHYCPGNSCHLWHFHLERHQRSLWICCQYGKNIPRLFGSITDAELWSMYWPMGIQLSVSFLPCHRNCIIM